LFSAASKKLTGKKALQLSFLSQSATCTHIDVCISSTTGTLKKKNQLSLTHLIIHKKIKIMAVGSAQVEYSSF